MCVCGARRWGHRDRQGPHRPVTWRLLHHRKHRGRGGSRSQKGKGPSSRRGFPVSGLELGRWRRRGLCEAQEWEQAGPRVGRGRAWGHSGGPWLEWPECWRLGAGGRGPGAGASGLYVSSFRWVRPTGRAGPQVQILPHPLHPSHPRPGALGGPLLGLPVAPAPPSRPALSYRHLSLSCHRM